ncbi:MAG: hypothetical protein HOV79_04735 [Hamadaea sp.]|nr:hypothetical protein [Hamadaea sp.]
MNQPDLDLLADYVGGALASAEAERVGERIRTDRDWATAHAELAAAFAEVDAALSAEAAAVEPMPDAVWARLTSAFAAEPEPGAPDAVPTSAAWAPPEARVGEPVRELHVPQGTRAPVDNRPAARSRASRRRRWVPVLAGLALFVALGLGIPALAPLFSARNDGSLSGGKADTPASAPLSLPPVSVVSGRDYTAQTLVLATDFGDVLTFSAGPSTEAAQGTDGSAKSARSSAPVVSPVPSPLARLAEPAALSGCLQALSGVAPGEVLGVDFARYQGAPALIVVTRDTAGERWAAVTGPDCGIGGQADLRLRQRIG